MIIKSYMTALFVGVVALSPVVAMAQYQLPGNFGLSTQTGAANTISSVIGFLAGLLAALAMLMIVVAGIMYIVSAGDQSRIDLAKRILTYAIVGLIVALLAWVIVNVISNTLGAGGGGGGGDRDGWSFDICYTDPNLDICAGRDGI